MEQEHPCRIKPINKYSVSVRYWSSARHWLCIQQEVGKGLPRQKNAGFQDDIHNPVMTHAVTQMRVITTNKIITE